MCVAGLVAQSVMSATDTLGHPDENGLSAIDPRLRPRICLSTMHKDFGMLSKPGVGNHPRHVCAWG